MINSGDMCTKKNHHINKTLYKLLVYVHVAVLSEVLVTVARTEAHMVWIRS
jgi:hypothetical protein